MIINLAIGPVSLGGDPTDTTFPMTFEVDYVKYWTCPNLPPKPPDSGDGQLPAGENSYGGTVSFHIIMASSPLSPQCHLVTLRWPLGAHTWSTARRASPRRSRTKGGAAPPLRLRKPPDRCLKSVRSGY